MPLDEAYREIGSAIAVDEENGLGALGQWVAHTGCPGRQARRCDDSDEDRRALAGW